MFMAEQTHFLTANDRTKLFTRAWLPDAVQSDWKGVICLIHGFGEHVGRYVHVADFFNKNGYAFIGMDTRGHGQSEGKRGHTPQYDVYLDDIQLFLNDVKSKYKSTPLFLYGHSMGGNLVLNFVLKRKPDIVGLVASGPLIQLSFKPKPGTITLGKIMRSVYPTLTLPGGVVPEHISKDPSVVEAYKNDPLVHSTITAAAGIGLTEANAWLDTYNGALSTPALIMHGDDDKLTSQPASEAFSKRVQGDITYKIWRGMYHEIHNEPDKIQVLTYMLGWLDSKI
jgi:alpha-beta hydrolase superfamily lysophospholipase